MSFNIHISWEHLTSSTFWGVHSRFVGFGVCGGKDVKSLEEHERIRTPIRTNHKSHILLSPGPRASPRSSPKPSVIHKHAYFKHQTTPRSYFPTRFPIILSGILCEHRCSLCLFVTGVHTTPQKTASASGATPLRRLSHFLHRAGTHAPEARPSEKALPPSLWQRCVLNLQATVHLLQIVLSCGRPQLCCVIILVNVP